MSEKEIIKERILRALDMLKVEEKEEYYEIELPVITFFNQQLITLRLYIVDDGYYVCTDGTTFNEYVEYASDDCEKYYDLFVRNNPNYHYDIKREGAYLYKKYAANYSARHAVNDFVRFFIHLDEYILDYWSKESCE